MRFRRYRIRKTEEFERLTGDSLFQFCKDGYVNKRMSCQEIAEKIHKNTNIIFVRQYIWKILKRSGVIRSQAESMKVRAITGRMDYVKSTKNIDYKNRKIDYKSIVEKRRARKADLLKTKFLFLSANKIKQLRERAKKQGLTLSDTIKAKYYPRDQYKKYQVLDKAKQAERQKKYLGSKAGNYAKRAYKGIVKKICKVCGKQFMPSKVRHLFSFCTKKCRRAYYKSLLK